MHPWHDVSIGEGAPEEFGGPADAVEAVRSAMDPYEKRHGRKMPGR